MNMLNNMDNVYSYLILWSKLFKQTNNSSINQISLIISVFRNYKIIFKNYILFLFPTVPDKWKLFDSFL